ncbi:hypothetical protein [Streptomyces sp. NRRL S-1813]|nr:hypothetical protein [Streptomyces sp. NRRL S-1813]
METGTPFADPLHIKVLHDLVRQDSAAAVVEGTGTVQHGLRQLD